jgi:hypothetical protein
LEIAGILNCKYKYVRFEAFTAVVMKMDFVTINTLSSPPSLPVLGLLKPVMDITKQKTH